MTPFPDTSHWSLTRRQLVILGGALTLLAIVLGIGGSWFIAGVAERMSDRMLAASVQSIIDTIGVEHGQVTLEVPPAAFGMLEDSARDNVYYRVHQGSRTLTGYTDFPQAIDAPVDDREPLFRYDHFLRQRVRVAAAVRHVPQMVQPVIVEVAETLDERRALTRNMLLGLGLLEAALVGFAVFLVWPAIRWGLRPMTAFQRRIAARQPGEMDFTPLDTAGVTPELAGLVSGFNQLLRQLGEATERSRRFTADASHQMRTPLAVLRAHVELLQRIGHDDPRHAGTVTDVGEATDRLQRLLTQLLALAKAEQDGDDDAGQCDAAEVVRALCLRLAPQAGDAGLELHFDADGTFPVRLPALLLQEMIANLVDNAIRYSSGGSYVTVRVSTAAGRNVIEVIDDGPGIPLEMQAVAVKRFFRLPQHQCIAGSGLGLSIAAALAERAGGKLGFFGGDATGPFGICVTFGG